MSTILVEPTASSALTAATTSAQRLRATTTAVRLGFTWLGVRKSLSADQQAQAADTFGAERDCLSASKRLIDIKHPAFKQVTAVKSRVTSYFKSLSLPYPEPGIRLIRCDQVAAFNSQLQEFRGDLSAAVDQLSEHYAELRSAARDRLGDLYDPADYPASLEGLFAVQWDFVSVEPPHYLQQLNPEIYQQECQRVQARFNEAIQLAEEAFLEELQRLVAHLTERLSGETDGKPKVFRDSAVENLTSFFRRFRELNINSNAELDELCEQCQGIVRGLQPQTLRESQTLRQTVASELGQVQSVLDDLLIDRPRRNILRRPR